MVVAGVSWCPAWTDLWIDEDGRQEARCDMVP